MLHGMVDSCQDPPPRRRGGGPVELQGRSAVVIGSGGIGRGIALGLAGAGVQLVVADIDPASSGAVAAEVTAAGGRAVAATVDATSRESLAALAELAVAELGAVHVMANTVGVITNRRLDEATEAEWAWLLEFNVMALVRAVDVFLPHLRAHGGPAHIVNTSSMAGLLALPPAAVGGFFNGLYTTTKHALVGYCDMLRSELEPEGIGVSVLCPGLVAGNLATTSAKHRPDRFGGPGPDQSVGAGAVPGAMPNEEIGPTVARGIAANRRYIFTHWDDAIVGMVEARHREVLDDFAFYASDPG
jgi:NAD(P)-dependent dehydrogenase (short-subunit alcohol dehydrogenase family)